jgi:NAD(P)-dependent dehydrogenase (short-subunit alcohol dehydrogenase family)
LGRQAAETRNLAPFLLTSSFLQCSCHDSIDSFLNNGRRVALVTGGATGIGRALCEELAARGSFVVVADINLAGAKEVAAALERYNCGAEAVGLDVSRATDVEAVVSDIAARHKQLDFIFNNAAVAAVGELRDGNMEDFRRIVDVNLFGVVHGTLAAYRVMLRQGFGHIVNVSSMTGLMPTPIVSAYSTTKWAIIGFSLGLRAEASELGVKVSVACPGLVQTSISDRNAYWNVNKQDYLKWLPWRNHMLGPAEAARAILRGVERNRDIIVFPFSARVGWRLYRLFPTMFNPLLRRTVRSFRALRLQPRTHPILDNLERASRSRRAAEREKGIESS